MEQRHIQIMMLRYTVRQQCMLRNNKQARNLLITGKNLFFPIFLCKTSNFRNILVEMQHVAAGKTLNQVLVQKRESFTRKPLQSPNKFTIARCAKSVVLVPKPIANI